MFLGGLGALQGNGILGNPNPNPTPMSLIVKFVAATVLVPQLILVLVYLDILEQNVLSVNALDLTRQIPMFALVMECALLLMIVDVTMDILV